MLWRFSSFRYSSRVLEYAVTLSLFPDAKSRQPIECRCVSMGSKPNVQFA